MTLQTVFNNHDLPIDLRYQINDFLYGTIKNQYDNVLKELILSYNEGLWWLSYMQFVPVLDFREQEVEEDLPKKVEFTTWNEDSYICEQAITREHLMNELKYYYSYLMLYQEMDPEIPLIYPEEEDFVRDISWDFE